MSPAFLRQDELIREIRQDFLLMSHFFGQDAVIREIYEASFHFRDSHLIMSLWRQSFETGWSSFRQMKKTIIASSCSILTVRYVDRYST